MPRTTARATSAERLAELTEMEMYTKQAVAIETCPERRAERAALEIYPKRPSKLNI